MFTQNGIEYFVVVDNRAQQTSGNAPTRIESSSTSNQWTTVTGTALAPVATTDWVWDWLTHTEWLTVRLVTESKRPYTIKTSILYTEIVIVRTRSTLQLKHC